MAALEQFSDAGRLSRGRSYANNGKVKSFEIAEFTAMKASKDAISEVSQRSG